MKRFLVSLLFLSATTAAGCVEVENQSFVNFAFGTAVTSPCTAIRKFDALRVLQQAAGTPDCTGDPAQDRFTYHYELWATVRRSGSVYVTSFTVQPHILKDEAYGVEVGDAKLGYELLRLEKQNIKLANGAPFKVGVERTFNELSADEKEETVKRMALTSARLAVTTYSSKMFQDPVNKVLAKDFYLGSHSQLTRPFNGRYHGQVEGGHPFGPGSTLSGGLFDVPAALEDVDELWVTIEAGEPDRPQRKPSSLVYLQGGVFDKSRETGNVKAVCPYDSAVTATFAVWPKLDERDYF